MNQDKIRNRSLNFEMHYLYLFQISEYLNCYLNSNIHFKCFTPIKLKLKLQTNSNISKSSSSRFSFPNIYQLIDIYVPMKSYELICTTFPVKLCRRLYFLQTKIIYLQKFKWQNEMKKNE